MMDLAKMVFGFAGLFACFSALAGYGQENGGYISPYRVNFTIPIKDLCVVDNYPPRNDPKLESSTNYREWYSRRVLKKFGVWGPRQRRFPPIADYDQLSLEWKRERLLAVAVNMIGLPYQHHHLPDWDPPPSWPWKPVAYGRNSKGMDCSDFTAWVYNYGLGIRLSTGIGQQAREEAVPRPDGPGLMHVKTIRNENGYDLLVQSLATGDLLYIKNKKGKLAHVIMWVGAPGVSPDGVPLVIDSTGPEHTDCNGNPIPIGVQLRPFRQNSWYYKSFSHAHRIINQ